jgi:hypothetical protein
MARNVRPQKFVATKSIVNAISTGGWTAPAPALTVADAAKTVGSGALTANTLATVLSITGAGEMPLLALSSVDGTSRTMRMQVICDGVTVFDSTSAAFASGSRGAVVVGNIDNNYRIFDGDPIRWNSSLLVKVASSLTETDKINIHYRYALA